jgi:predicted DNA-binding transcriptional regulator
MITISLARQSRAVKARHCKNLQISLLFCKLIQQEWYSKPIKRLAETSGFVSIFFLGCGTNQNMDSTSKLRDPMLAFGFSETLIAVYSFLLSQESAHINQIAKATCISPDKVQQEIEHLLELQVVAFDVIKNKYILYVLDPDIVWTAFIKSMTWKFVHTLNDNDIDVLISNLPEQDHLTLQRLREIVDAIRIAAMGLYKGTGSITKHRWRDALDINHMSQVLAEAIQQAKSQICAVSNSPRLPHVALIWESILKRISDSIAYKRVADLTEIIEHGISIIRRDVEYVGVNLRVLDTDDIKHKFYVIDRSLLVVFHSVGLPDMGAKVGRVTDQAEIIRRYRKRFGNYYENGVPAQFVIDMLTQAGTRLLKHADALGYKSDELDWLQCLINWGTFCTKEGPFVQRVSHKALNDDLVHRGTTGKLIPSYDIKMKDIKANWITQSNQPR